MKTLVTLSAAALITFLTPAIVDGQTVINITSNANASSYGNRSNYIFNITPGYTFTMDGTYTYTNVTFNGGTIAISTAINSNSIVTFTNDTVLINASQTVKSMNFNGDSVAINQTLSYNNGVTEIANSRVSINANTSFQSANLITDSIHLNATLSYNGNPDSVSDSHITMSNGSSWTWQKPIISNSVFNMMGNSSMTSNSNLVASNSAFYEESLPTGTPTNLTISGTVTLTNTDVVLSNSSTASISGVSTVTGGSIVETGSAKLTLNNNINLSGTKVSVKGTSSLSNTSNINLTGGASMSIGDGSGTATVSANTINVSGGSLLGVAPNSTVTLGSGKLNGSTGTPYTVSTLHGCATFDDTKAPQTCTILALGDIVLTATGKGPGEAILSWTDAATDPVNEYLVQRSTGNDTWSPIGTIDANASATGTYSFIDADAPAGEVFYRIERVAADGTLGYSPISTVTSVANTRVRTGIFPNPAVGGRFYLTTPGTEETIVNVFTSTGQLLLHAALQGQTQYPIQLPSQPLSLSALVVQTIYQNNTRSFTLLIR